ncbi:hypothetical protein BHE74_00041401, partial [Ensete ventricosum]
TEVSDLTRSREKLATNWEGPYHVVDVIREGTCTLTTIEGDCCSERGTYRISKIFMHNLFSELGRRKVMISLIKCFCLQKEVGYKIRLHSTRVSKLGGRSS